MKQLKLILTLGFLVLFPFWLQAQHKYEREFRIKAETIPQSAKDFIDSIGADSRIKWYKEISLDDITLEAKFKHNNKKFSVEFDSLGKLQDLEYVINKSEINPEVYTIIERKLDSVYQKWKFQKIQIHYSGKNEDIISAIRRNERDHAINMAYEIVLKGKNNNETQLYEITFSEQGALQKSLLIIQDKADHLEY